MVKRKRFKKNQPFKWKHYSGEIILWLVRWYGRYALSYRDLKEIAAERGVLRLSVKNRPAARATWVRPC
ncbi:hypothetical protein PsalN5692_03779 (plasmid) [Piscirickettsia salmonis]|nr:hypothetical protein PsalN5692_03779 [Piscirickettsia salmonis]